jgi:hypothetical protein
MPLRHARTRTQSLMSCFWLRSALLILFGILASTTLCAQVLYGTLTGNVLDKTGAIVPSATVMLTNQETGDVRTVQADSHGTYVFVNLLPSHYTIKIAATPNFSGFTEKDAAAADGDAGGGGERLGADAADGDCGREP